ncbi:MAG: hypothetical protein H6Q89_1757 [Myxococcaceae bacterium]|nr:hypothetical protein [Myxococcaceae bacterium]
MRFGLLPFLLVLTACGVAPDPNSPADGNNAHPDAGISEIDGGEDAGPADAGFDGGIPDAGGSGCPAVMARINGFCVDRYEAHVVRLEPDGGEQPHSPFLVVDNLTVRAKVSAGVVPQGYLSQVQAAAACAQAGKRLCTAPEFALACRGPDAGNFYPYGGTTKVPGACNEGKGSSVPRFYGSNPATWTYAAFNDPRLNQWDGGLAPTGAFTQCVSPFGVHDCVGNLHEWGADAPDVNGRGRFRGGFYGDAEINGQGCKYLTSAHGVTYHDYSTGFRCCADAGS